MKVVITGGHLTPALAYIEYCQKHTKDVDLYFFGRRFSQSNRRQKAIEEESVSSLGVPFFAIDVPKLNSHLPWELLIFIAQYCKTTLDTLRYLIRIKPDTVLTFGGYMAVPVAILAWLLRIPIVTHEQTTTAGRANRFIGHFATRIAVSFETSTPFFPPQKTTITGNPIRAALLHPQKNPPSWFKIQSKKPLLYITGGNQGSHVINAVTEQILRQLTRDYVVIHACGRATSSTDYLHELQQVARSLPNTHQNRYFIREWITTKELAWILQNAQLAVSRAGANTIQEFIKTKTPALLVPLPFSYHNEQAMNAKIMSEYGGAITIPQKDFTPETALSTIREMMSVHKALKRKLSLIELPENSAAALHTIITEVAK